MPPGGPCLSFLQGKGCSHSQGSPQPSAAGGQKPERGLCTECRREQSEQGGAASFIPILQTGDGRDSGRGTPWVAAASSHSHWACPLQPPICSSTIDERVGLASGTKAFSKTPPLQGAARALASQPTCCPAGWCKLMQGGWVGGWAERGQDRPPLPLAPRFLLPRNQSPALQGSPPPPLPLSGSRRRGVCGSRVGGAARRGALGAARCTSTI
jgi:hypothetical protein